jgi:V8-like Glu-specific endopeptidase
MTSRYELDEFEAAPGAPARASASRATTSIVRRHPRLGYVQLFPGTTRSRSAQGELDSEVTLHDDSRGPVMDTAPVPYRFVCWLDLDFGPDPATGLQITGRGTGTLISPRHVLTAGHNLFDDIAPGVRRAVQIVRVGPGFNCIAKRGDVFGMATSLRTRVSARWAATLDDQFDYGVITLRTPIGASRPAALGGRQLGWWGSGDTGEGTRINPVDPARLARRRVNISGYPGDKCCVRAIDLTQQCRTNVPLRPCRADLWATAQFRSFGQVTNAQPAAANRLIFYDLDTCGGHSGGPLWVKWHDERTKTTYRNLVAIHTGPASAIDPALSQIANRGVRITQDVMTEVAQLMRPPAGP